MEETRKTHEFVAAEDDLTQKKKKQQQQQQRATALADEDTENLTDDILAWLSVDADADDDTVGELLMLLDDAEKSKPLAEKVKFIDNPYSSAMIFQSSSSYVTINGNEESCGSSFSDSDSSMMASIDMSGANMKLMEIDSETTVKKWKSSCSEDQLKAEDGDDEEEVARGWMEDLDELSWDDEDLARFIGEEEQLF